MQTVTMPKNKRTAPIVLPPIDYSKIKTGHRPHRGGVGIHQDGRTNRLRTRAAQRHAALSER